MGCLTENITVIPTHVQKVKDMHAVIAQLKTKAMYRIWDSVHVIINQMLQVVSDIMMQTVMKAVTIPTCSMAMIFHIAVRKVNHMYVVIQM